MGGKIICIDINAGLILEAKRRILRRRFSSSFAAFWSATWDQFNQFLDHILRGLDDEEERDDSSTS